MSTQFGFDFADSAAPVYAERSVGSWEDPKFNTAQYLAMFDEAAAIVSTLDGAIGELFRQGLDTSRNVHQAMLEHAAREPGETYRLWRTTDFAPEKKVLSDFLALIGAASVVGATSIGGRKLQAKYRSEARVTAAAAYIEGAGSIVVRTWPDPHSNELIVGVDYNVSRDTFFMPSYRDAQRSVYAPASVFDKAYCADKLASAFDKPASVPTFKLDGREYVNDGGYSHREYSECEGWSFCSLSDWTGPTYTYGTQVKAWDEGRIERGDRRGLVVSVRGQLAVLDGAILVYDDRAVRCTSAAEAATKADDELDADAIEQDDEATEE